MTSTLQRADFYVPNVALMESRSTWMQASSHVAQWHQPSSHSTPSGMATDLQTLTAQKISTQDPIHALWSFMSDFIPLDELIADIERAREDKDTPAWVAVLLRTVLMLVKAMESEYEKKQKELAASTAELEALEQQLNQLKSEQRSSNKAARSNRKPSKPK